MHSTPISALAAKGYWSEQDARIVVEAWRRSGERPWTFAKRHGVVPQRLTRWAARLNQNRVDETPRFHPVRLVRSPADESGGRIEIELSGGPRVCVERRFDPEDLRRVLVVLAEHATC